ncbi:hypothetical protein B4N84_22430 [Flavobacterium sp. IR1]|nr:hypothetical protein B4N84_22430 [Flavobacterium sp. IR1]
MKRIKPIFLVFFVSLIFASSFAAAPTPPEPMTSQAVSAAACDDCPPPPPPKDTPINANIILLLVGGLTLGMSVIYKNKTKKALI